MSSTGRATLSASPKASGSRRSTSPPGSRSAASSGCGWSQAGLEYLTGFVVEKSLALDNIFVIALIFAYFAIPAASQHRVLVYGIVGVLILRGIMIAAGAAIVDEFSWVLYLFAAFLVITGIKMLFSADKRKDLGSNPALRFMTRHLRMTDTLEGEAFLVRRRTR